MKNFKKIRTTVNILGVIVGLVFLGGVFEINYSEGVTILSGLIILVLTTLLVIWANKNNS